MADDDQPEVATRARRKDTADAPSAVDRFSDQLCPVALESNALERFCQASVEWIKSVWAAQAVSSRLAVTDSAALPDNDKDIHLDDLLRACARHFKPEIDGAYSELLVIARDAGCLSQVKEVLCTAMAGLHDFLSAACAPAVPIGRPSRGSTMLDARGSVLGALRELERVRPLLASGLRHRSTLTRRQREIWELLREQALLDKEIAKQLSGKSSPGSVRNMIQKMRSGCWQIEHVPSVGYFRTDAPPADLN